MEAKALLLFVFLFLELELFTGSGTETVTGSGTEEGQTTVAYWAHLIRKPIVLCSDSWAEVIAKVVKGPIWLTREKNNKGTSSTVTDDATQVESSLI